VSAERNAAALAAALAHNPKLAIVRLPDENHLFQKARSGAMDEYGTLEPRFSSNFQEALNDWLVETVRP
jgi:hypothetical protein